MTSFKRSVNKPQSNGRFLTFDYVEFYVGNAKQAAAHYCAKFGFQPVAYRGLETSTSTTSMSTSRQFASHVIRQNDVTFMFTSAYDDKNDMFNRHVIKHGDGVKRIALAVENLQGIIDVAKKNGGKILRDIWTEMDDQGHVKLAEIQTFGDCSHILLDRSQYNGVFLPHFHDNMAKDPLNGILPASGICRIDHVVGNLPDGEMATMVTWYERVFEFHRFWSVDEKQMHTDYSALRSTVMANWDETIKMPLNEPARGKKKSQIQEFVDYYGGAGVQHIALYTCDIVTTVQSLKSRGVQFLAVPSSYYTLIREKLKADNFRIKEDLDILAELKILIDYDENGYLLQIFAKNLQDRPTFFIEIIQRNNHDGFGAGNFKALFEAIELEQEQRGNL